VLLNYQQPHNPAPWMAPCLLDDLWLTLTHHSVNQLDLVGVCVV